MATGKFPGFVFSTGSEILAVDSGIDNRVDSGTDNRVDSGTAKRVEGTLIDVDIGCETDHRDSINKMAPSIVHPGIGNVPKPKERQ